ncbi:YrrS family protein [Vagococcus sp.]|uniref:YrrS family protein n=1 Tax=Vagococcus sp. TaxID=1933889 RepID=UPI003F94E026
MKKVNRLFKKIVLIIFCLIAFISAFQIATHKKESLLIGGENIALMDHEKKYQAVNQPLEINKKKQKPMEKKEKIKTKQIIATQNPNVIQSYLDTSWKPIGTKQTEPHIFSFDNNSQDRIEMRKVISNTLHINATNIEEWWLSMYGPNDVEAYVSNRETNQHYRVLISWVVSKGYQAKQVDELHFLPEQWQ